TPFNTTEANLFHLFWSSRVSTSARLSVFMNLWKSASVGPHRYEVACLDSQLGGMAGRTSEPEPRLVFGLRRFPTTLSDLRKLAVVLPVDCKSYGQTFRLAGVGRQVAKLFYVVRIEKKSNRPVQGEPWLLQCSNPR